MFKNKLKELREKNELTQQQLANKLFVSRSAVAKWENGLGIPSNESINLLCVYFNITRDELLKENDVINVYHNLEKKAKYDITIMKILLFVILFLVAFVILYNTYVDYKNIKYKIINSSDYYETEYIIHDINTKYKLDYINIKNRAQIIYDEIVIHSLNSYVITEDNNIEFMKVGKHDIFATFINRKEKQKFYMKILSVYCYDSLYTILINDLDDLYYINNNLTGSYILNSDIDLRDVKNYEPIKGTFKGVFINPNNYVIKNMNIVVDEYIESRSIYLGFFESIEEAYINNLILENVNISAKINDDYKYTDVGAICGLSNNSYIENCKVTGFIQGQDNVGGMIGYAMSTKIKNCMFVGEVRQESTIKSDCYAGGLIGYSSHLNEITNNIVNLRLYSTSYGGELIGFEKVDYMDNILASTFENNIVFAIIDAVNIYNEENDNK